MCGVHATPDHQHQVTQEFRMWYDKKPNDPRRLDSTRRNSTRMRLKDILDQIEMHRHDGARG